MNDLRDTIAKQMGLLLLANIEQAFQIEQLKRTQSEGKKQAEQMLDDTPAVTSKSQD